MSSHQYRNSGHWPIWEETATPPPGWSGWPGGKRFAIVLTHDVELEGGFVHCGDLADLEEERGLRSAFGFVPRCYRTPERVRRMLVDRGFEVMVHDVDHDGKLYPSWPSFAERSGAINEFLREWETSGFSPGAMHHNLPWISQLNINYSISTYGVDPFEPQALRAGPIFPCWVQSPNGAGSAFVEMPYALPRISRSSCSCASKAPPSGARSWTGSPRRAGWRWSRRIPITWFP